MSINDVNRGLDSVLWQCTWSTEKELLKSLQIPELPTLTVGDVVTLVNYGRYDKPLLKRIAAFQNSGSSCIPKVIMEAARSKLNLGVTSKK